jgi:ubiquinone/menaquinone biosynthesis C-methylase UbiE
MRHTNVSLDAKDNPKDFYNRRYEQGYMHGWYDVYEICRVYTVKKVLNRLTATGFSPASILDYGCGEGRYIGELKRIFPSARVVGCDISETALDIGKRAFPEATFTSMQDETVGYADGSFDLVISIEVLEHVQDVAKAAHEVARLLRVGGLALITTPCANRFSGEWFKTALRSGFEPSHDGYGRFYLDEPGHLRRLRDSHLRDLFEKNGVAIEKIYHRSHMFTPIVEHRFVSPLIPMAARARIALLDWHFFKHLPNGSTLLAIGRKL